MSMESLLFNDNNSSLHQTKSSKKKPHHQHQGTPRMPNISRHKSCSAIHQKYAPSPNAQLEMVQAALVEDLFLNHYRKQFSLNSSLPPILPILQRPHYHHHHQQQPQPPLLPLPFVSKPTFRSFPPSPVPRKKPNKIKTAPTTTTTTTTRKPPQNLKKENKKNDQVVDGPRKVTGPNPVSDPKGSETRVLTDTDLNNSEVTKEVPSIFSLVSPPPSSLPLPKFTMRPNKLSCNAEAAADEAATDNLRRLLKLR